MLWLSSTPMLAQKDSLSWDAPESISLEDSITLDSAKLSKALAPKALRKKRDWATWRPNTKPWYCRAQDRYTTANTGSFLSSMEVLWDVPMR